MEEFFAHLKQCVQMDSDCDEHTSSDEEEYSFTESGAESSDSSCWEGNSSESENPHIPDDCHQWNPLRSVAVPPPPRFPFYKNTSHSVGNLSDDPLDFFNLFFDDKLIEIVSVETNRYATQNSLSNWNPVTSHEIRVFLALIMLQGLVNKPIYWMYWTKNPLMETPFFGKCMSFKRFRLINRFLHFYNNNEFDPSSHPQPKLNKIYSIYEHLCKKFKSNYELDRDVTINESLMFFKGQLNEVHYIPLNKQQFGVKYFMLCESKTGYVYDLIIYTGKATRLDRDFKDLPISSQIVMTLMKPLLGKGHCLTTDSFYTCPMLADRLIQYQTDIYGTVKLNRKEMPSQIKRKLKKGETLAFQRGKTTVLKWKDKRDVTFLSTIHTLQMVESKCGSQKYVIPQVVKDFSTTMGGVDRHNRSFSTHAKRGKKYYKKIFFHLLEIVVWNSYVLFSSRAGQKISCLEFRMKLVELLVAKHKTYAKPSGRPGTFVNPLRLTGRHFPDSIPPTKKTNPTRTCFVCSRKKDARGKRVRRESRYFCSECDVALCVTPCFREYHTKLDF